MRILVVNAGSSSLKLRLLDGSDSVMESADLPADSDGFDVARVGETLSKWATPDAIGHRVVHGGSRFSSAVVLDDAVYRELRGLTSLAPLHQPKSLDGVDIVHSLLPSVTAVACFDTAFHQTLPPAAYTYAIPTMWRESLGVRRYGFHGLSHGYCARRAAQMLGRPLTQLRIVTCHLGAGASLCAVAGGRSVDTTMGFTPLEGLVMATRSGTVDPGLGAWLQVHHRMTAQQVAEQLEYESGLLSLCGTADMREIIQRMSAHDSTAGLAFTVYMHRLVTHIAAMTAAAGGLDVLAFTGGVGERAAAVRARAAERLAWLGVAIDPDANERVHGDADISASDARVRSVVVEAREDLEIARQTREAISASG